VVMLVPLIVLVVHSTVRFCGRGLAAPASSCSRKRRPVLYFLSSWYGSDTAYADCDWAPGFVDRWDHAGLFDYHRGMQWYGAAEMFVGAVTGVLGGLTALGPSWCTALNAAQVVVVVGFAAVTLALRPHVTRADRWLSTCSAGLQAATALFGAAGRDVAISLGFIQLVAVAVHTSLFVAFGLVGGAARMFETIQHFRGRTRRPRRGRARNGGQRHAQLTEEELKEVVEAEEIRRLVGSEGRDEDIQASLRFLVEIICRR
jgi:hypothetical protein